MEKLSGWLGGGVNAKEMEMSKRRGETGTDLSTQGLVDQGASFLCVCV